MTPGRRGGFAKLGIAVVIVGAVAWFGWRQGHLGAQIDRCMAFFREAGALPFFTAMTFLPIFGFPVSPFTLAAGPVFGPTMGAGNVILCSMLAMTINVALSYWIAARALRPLMVRLVKRLGYDLPEIQPDAAWTAILLLRIVPGTPFFLQSYLLGLARVPFGPYMLISVVVPAAYVSATVLFGDALMRGDRWAMAGAAVLFVVAGGVIHQIRRKFRTKTAVAGGAAWGVAQASQPAPEDQANVEL